MVKVASINSVDSLIHRYGMFLPALMANFPNVALSEFATFSPVKLIDPTAELDSALDASIRKGAR
jgi:hypothetical protein